MKDGWVQPRLLISMLPVLLAACGVMDSPVARGQERHPTDSRTAVDHRSTVATSSRTWPLGPIDSWIELRHLQHGLTPSAIADPITRLRRVTLTLTGLPPTLDQLAQFREELQVLGQPDAWHRQVDRLLASPAHGERLASWWLDLARYADTHGYHADRHRDMWRWRDWVIAAFNQHRRFDEFSIEQLAGDLLPGATINERIATGFLRNHMILYEDGAIDEEYRTEYVAERVATVGAVWLGQTLACARCHDHKYDPITQQDFYQLAAFFNNVPEKGIDGHYGNASPVLIAPTDLQLHEEQRLKKNIQSTQQWLDARWKLAGASREAIVAAQVAQRRWEDRRRGAQPSPLKIKRDQLVSWPDEAAAKQRLLAVHGPADYVPGRDGDVLLFTGETWVDVGDQADLDHDRPLTISVWVYPTTANSMTIVSRQLSGAASRGYDLSLQELKPQWRMIAEPGHNERIVSATQPLALRRWQHLVITQPASSRADRVRFFVDGRQVDVQVERDTLSRSIRNAAALEIGRRGEMDYWRGMLDELLIYDRVLSEIEIAALDGNDSLTRILSLPATHRTAEQALQLRKAFLEESDAEFQEQTRRLSRLQSQLAELQRSFPTSMVMQEQLERRPTYILRAGRYDSPLDEVQAKLPTWLRGPDVSSTSKTNPTRLDLARWIMSPGNPLTARVIVSRVWQLHWGQGLVSTADDFGVRGEAPRFPELYHGLAADFARDWDLQRLERQIVTAAAFQQQGECRTAVSSNSAKHGSSDANVDPENLWLTRGPTRRMTAEMVRDVALASSQLVDRQIGGRSVFPWQPAGLWDELAFETEGPTAQLYRTSRGSGLVRRSLYTYWKRAALAPTLTAFDAPDRELCVLDRPRSKTPQQALVLMNDPTRWYAARILAQRSLARQRQSLSDTAARTHTPGTNIDLDRAVLDEMLQRVTSRSATRQQQDILLGLLQEQRREFQGDIKSAQQLLSVEKFIENNDDQDGDDRMQEPKLNRRDDGGPPVVEPLDPNIPISELAAWTSVAHLILSLPAAVEIP